MTVGGNIEEWVRDSPLREAHVMHLGGMRFGRVFASGSSLRWSLKEDRKDDKRVTLGFPTLLRVKPSSDSPRLMM